MWQPRSKTWTKAPVTRWKPGGRNDASIRQALDHLGQPRPRTQSEYDNYDAASERNRQIYQESTRICKSFVPVSYGMQPGGPEYLHFINGNCYEFARFHAGSGESGFVKGIQTTLQNQLMNWYGTSAGGSPFDPYAVNIDRWNQPMCPRFTWYLRLFQQDEPLDINWHKCGHTDLPGSALPEANQWSDGRHVWGSPANVWWLVPRGFYLRLFFGVVDGAENIYQCGARLWGYTQPANSEAALFNAQKGWY